MDIWTWANQTMGSVYGKLVGISTLAGVLAVVVCLIWRMISANPKSVEVCNTWIKRIVITWIIINVLGFIINYIQPLVKGGQYQVTSGAAIIAPLFFSHIALFPPHFGL